MLPATLLVSAAAIAYEILLMRLLAIIQWHHFAWMIISLALLGYGASGTEVNRLMNGGADRPLAERAVLQGQGPAMFCEDEYTYLRMILPSAQPADTTPRPPS